MAISSETKTGPTPTANANIDIVESKLSANLCIHKRKGEGKAAV